MSSTSGRGISSAIWVVGSRMSQSRYEAGVRVLGRGVASRGISVVAVAPRTAVRSPSVSSGDDAHLVDDAEPSGQVGHGTSGAGEDIL